jgi:iron complex transport system substrate-binding protein
VIEIEENRKCTNGYHSISEYSWVLITKKRNSEAGKE